MGLTVIYELLRRFFWPVVFPVIMAVGIYFKGCSDGERRCNESQQQTQKEVERGVREAEVQNQKITEKRLFDKSADSNRSLSELVELFNKEFDRQTRRNISSKTDP